MSLSSLQLDAFWALAQQGHFSKAATSLHLTQSALSQRIMNLEEAVGTTLVIREPRGIRLTDVGQELLRYVQKKQALEEEFQGQIGAKEKSGAGSLSGRIRIGSFSSLMHSVLFPALDGLLSAHSELVIDAHTREVRQLEELLRQGSVDYIVNSQEWHKEGIKALLLGEEESILIEPKISRGREKIFLDHDPEDRTTEDFWKLNGLKAKDFRRCFVDDVSGILEGVSLGWGSAIVPKHLLGSNERYLKKIKMPKGYRSLKSSVWLYHYDQPYYTRLQQAVLKALTTQVPKLL